MTDNFIKIHVKGFNVGNNSWIRNKKMVADVM